MRALHLSGSAAAGRDQPLRARGGRRGTVVRVAAATDSMYFTRIGCASNCMQRTACEREMSQEQIQQEGVKACDVDHCIAHCRLQGELDMTTSASRCAAQVRVAQGTSFRSSGAATGER